MLQLQTENVRKNECQKERKKQRASDNDSEKLKANESQRHFTSPLGSSSFFGIEVALTHFLSNATHHHSPSPIQHIIYKIYLFINLTLHFFNFDALFVCECDHFTLQNTPLSNTQNATHQITHRRNSSKMQILRQTYKFLILITAFFCSVYGR